jgi:hypothetical protein
MSFAGRWIRRVRNESSTDPHNRIRTWVRLFRLILLIPSWESQSAHPEEKRDPRKTFPLAISESSKALDLDTPNREGLINQANSSTLLR